MQRGDLLLIEEQYDNLELRAFAERMFNETLADRLSVDRPPVFIADDSSNAARIAAAMARACSAVGASAVTVETLLAEMNKIQPDVRGFGRALRMHAHPTVLPGESSDRKQYEAPRFKRGKNKRQKDYQL